MKTISIKAKITIVLICSLGVSAAIQVALVRNSFNSNVAAVSASSLSAAQRAFDNIKAKELSSLALASSGVASLEGVREVFLKGDREALHSYLTPLYTDLKALGVDVLTILDKDANSYMRMQAPKTFGDSLRKITTIRKTIETQQISAGIDLAKPGLSTGSCRPLRDKDGTTIGYIIVAKSLDDFLSTMKAQTADDYIMVGYKSFLDEGLYHATRKAKAQPDTWGQFANILVLAKTMEPNASDEYEKVLKSLPAEGKLLGQVTTGGGTYVRGAFPVYDAAGAAIGGIFVRHDITALHSGMKRVERLGVAAIVALMIFLSIVMAAVLQRLVFARLKHTMDIVTRVVGGDFSKKIEVPAADEVGRLEELFEQFRTIFVGVADELTKKQGEDEKRSA